MDRQPLSSPGASWPSAVGTAPGLGGRRGGGQLLRIVTSPEYEWRGDDYRCAVPGCTARRNLHDHHLRFRSAGGCDSASNRVTLCTFHHQRRLHAGLLRIQGRAPDGLVFELGLRPGAPPLIRYRSGDIEVPESVSRDRSNYWRIESA